MEDRLATADRLFAEGLLVEAADVLHRERLQARHDHRQLAAVDESILRMRHVLPPPERRVFDAVLREGLAAAVARADRRSRWAATLRRHWPALVLGGLAVSTLVTSVWVLTVAPCEGPPLVSARERAVPEPHATWVDVLAFATPTLAALASAAFRGIPFWVRFALLPGTWIAVALFTFPILGSVWRGVCPP